VTQTVVSPTSGSERSDHTPRRIAAPWLHHRRWLIASLTLILAVCAWGAVAAWVDDPILPRPADVGAQIFAIIASGAAVTNFAASITKIAAGFALAMVGGLVVGFVMGRSRFMAAYFSLPLFVLGNMPGLTYAVFGLLIFGVGAGGPIVVSALVALPFIAMNVAEGVRSIDGRLLDMCQAFERSHFDILRHLYLPALTTFVFAGVRYGFAMAWKVEALTEVFGAGSGVGFMIRKAYQEFRVDDMLAWTTLFIVAMVLIERALAYLEARFFAWRKEIA